MIQTLGWQTALGIAGGIVTIFGAGPYILETIKGRAKPNPASWLVWLLATGVAVVSQLMVGFQWPAVVIMAATFNAAVIFGLALKYGRWQFGLFNRLALVAVLAAIVVGLLTHSPTAAVALAVLADVLVSVPVTLGALRRPASETASSYLIFGLGATLGALSVGKPTLLYLLYPAYFIADDSLIGIASLLAGRRK